VIGYCAGREVTACRVAPHAAAASRCAPGGLVWSDPRRQEARRLEIALRVYLMLQVLVIGGLAAGEQARQHAQRIKPGGRSVPLLAVPIADPRGRNARCELAARMSQK
jgi:hypothetical protein